MILPFATTGSSLAGIPWALPGLENSVDPVLTYLSSAWPMWVLFFIGIGLGYFFRGRRKSPAPESETRETETPEPVSSAEPDDESVEVERGFGKVIAELEGRLRVEQQLGARLRREREALQLRLDSVRRQRDEKQERFETLSMTLAKASEQPGSSRSLAHARAPVIQLDELVQAERQHYESGLEWLRELEGRLAADSRDLWESAESVEGIRGQAKASFKDSESEKLLDQVCGVDEHLRVFCQNVEGCLQRIATTKLRLETDEKKLEEAAAPIAEAEAALADLAASEDSPDEPRLEAAFLLAHAKLSESLSAVESLENGIDQEIAELTGRIDWVVKDSPKNFLNALEDLNRIEAPTDREAGESFNEIWRHLAEARHILAGIQLPLDGSAFGESQHVSGKHRIIEALENAIAGLKSAQTVPPAATVDEPAKPDGRIAHLERQLALRESESARLDQKLKLTARELQQLREENERLSAESGLTAEEPTGGNFVRRLLGLAPGSVSTSPRPDRSPEVSGAESATSAVTLAEAREILSELKLVSTNGSGNGSNARSRQPDEAAPEISNQSDESEEPETETADAGANAAADDAELRHLREQVTRQKIRIDALEETIAERRKSGPGGAAVSPVPTSTPAPAPLGEPGRGTAGSILPGELVTTTGSEIVIFRGGDLAAWDSDFRGPDRQFAKPLETLPDDVHYLRMKRLDTGDSVVIPISRPEILAGTTAGGTGYGWSGKRERYFGSDHLGIYDESLPRDVETKFGAGGWGFGHVENIGSRQAYGWAGRQIEPTDFEISVGTEPCPAADTGTETEVPLAGELRNAAAVPDSGLIIFRSNNPAIWGEKTYSGANCRSRELDDLPDDIGWLRIRCLPGGESVIIPVTKADLTRNGDGLTRGFNGSNELFYGARHLGAFDESLPQDVETRFTYGGWGFGHCPSGPEEQACGWAGREIDQDTVFEFTVYRTMPAVDEFLDRVLQI